MLTGHSDPRPRRSRPLLALAAGLPMALAAMSGAIGLAAPASLDPLFDDESALEFPTPAPLPRREAVHGPCSGSDETSMPSARPAARPSAETISARLLQTPADDASTGLDLEVRIGRIRIEFPWLKSLPITPGRHLVLDLMPPRS